jgi:hypothetical protein
VREVLGPLNAVGDMRGLQDRDGRVITPTGFKEAWDKLYEAGWKTLERSRPSSAAQGAPHTLQAIVEELLSGANAAFNMYPGLAFGAAEVIAHFGTEEQKKPTCRACTAAPGAARCASPSRTPAATWARRSTTAKRNADGSYAIKGTKIYISGGDHDLAENVIHLVLARVDGAPAGTKGLSLFIVPRVRHDETARSARERRQVAAHRAQDGHQRLGDVRLNFGEDDAASAGSSAAPRTRACPDVPDDERARIGVGMQGVSVELGVPQRARVREGPQAGRQHHPLEGPHGAPRVDHRARRRAPHAARHEGARWRASARSP